MSNLNPGVVHLSLCLCLSHKKAPKAKALIVIQAAGNAQIQFEVGAQNSSGQRCRKSNVFQEHIAIICIRGLGRGERKEWGSD